MVVYDFETFSTDRTVPYAFGLYRHSKISDKTLREYEK